MSNTTLKAIDRVFKSLTPKEKQMANAFLEAFNRQKSSHKSEFKDVEYAKEASLYLHNKASAEAKGLPFESDFGIEAHVAECESCQHFYDIVQRALPVLDKIERVC